MKLARESLKTFVSASKIMIFLCINFIGLFLVLFCIRFVSYDPRLVREMSLHKGVNCFVYCVRANAIVTGGK